MDNSFMLKVILVAQSNSCNDLHGPVMLAKFKYYITNWQGNAFVIKKRLKKVSPWFFQSKIVVYWPFLPSQLNHLSKMCFESSEDFSSWISGLKSKTKSLYESTPLGVCILLLLGFLVLLYLLLLPFGFFAKSTPSKPLLLATALPVTPVNTMIQCDDKKAIHCLQIKHAFYTHDSQLYAKLQINTALKTGNHAPGQKLVPRTNYSKNLAKHKNP